MKKTLPDNRYRWQIAFRTLAAILGGYALANISAILLSYLLPMPKSDAVMTGILLSFAIYTCAIMWVFAVQSVHKAWLGLAIPSLVMGAAALLVKFTGVAP
ncbi:MAG: DUF3649 domain-containing protein [Cellvibrio sp.]|uniref:DUF3649 domain-containing protein n=1 Tax=Cellvibrio sp. TaxID=1965322 RepID=UPI0031AEF789